MSIFGKKKVEGGNSQTHAGLSSQDVDELAKHGEELGKHKPEPEPRIRKKLISKVKKYMSKMEKASNSEGTDLRIDLTEFEYMKTMDRILDSESANCLGLARIFAEIKISQTPDFATEEGMKVARQIAEAFRQSKSEMPDYLKLKIIDRLAIKNKGMKLFRESLKKFGGYMDDWIGMDDYPAKIIAGSVCALLAGALLIIFTSGVSDIIGRILVGIPVLGWGIGSYFTYRFGQKEAVSHVLRESIDHTKTVLGIIGGGPKGFKASGHNIRKQLEWLADKGGDEIQAEDGVVVIDGYTEANKIIDLLEKNKEEEEQEGGRND